VGDNIGTISSSYATGNVTGNNYTGGLVGYNDSGIITNSYSTGNVTGSYNTGSLVGCNIGYSSLGTIYYARISSSYSIQISGLNSIGAQGSYSIVSGVYAKSSTELKKQSTFTGWDFTSVWAIDEGKSYPYLRANEQIPHPGTN